jgi:NitT/TauT family transport system substrate-binding protein
MRLFGRKSVGALIAALLVAGLAACAPSTSTSTATPDGKPDKLSFRLDFFAQGLSAPFELAYEEGYYKEEGIDLTIGEGSGNVLTMQAVASGKEPLGYVAGETFVLGLSQDLPITAIGWITRKNPFGIMVDESIGAKSIKDLRGLEILATSGSSDQLTTEAVLALNGLKPDDVVFRSVDGAAKSSSFVAGGADAMAMPVTFGIPFLEGGSRPATALSYADFGWDALGYGIIVNNDFLKSNPDLVARFMAATMRGWEEGQKDPEAAVRAMQETFPDNTYDVATHTAMLELVYDFMDSKNTKGWPLGCMSAKDWDTTTKLVSEYSFPIDKPVTDIRKHWTNDYLPGKCPTK